MVLENIVLLRPPTLTPADGLNFSSISPPISLGYLTAVLQEANFSVTPIDAIGEDIDRVTPCQDIPGMQYHGISAEEIINKIPRNTNCLGVSIMFSSEWPFHREIIKKIKKALPDLVIIVGGEHVSALPEFVLQDCPDVDVTVVGEGEETVVELLRTLKISGNLNEVDGIAYRHRDRIIRTGERKRIRKVDDIPWPAWDSLPIKAYVNSTYSLGPHRGKSIVILATRGCPYKCKFCSNPNMYGINYYPREAKDVVDEIEHYVKTYAIQCIEFVDLTMMLKKSHIKEFCRELIDRKLDIAWQIVGTRTEAIDESIISIAKEAGCTYLGFAPESGSKKMLKEIQKQVDLDRMFRLFRIAKKYKMGTRANVVIGFPNDTRWTIYQSLWMQFRLVFLGVLDVPIFVFSPYPGSQYFHLMQDRGLIPPEAELNDGYFNSLGQGLPVSRRKRYCKNVGPRELWFYQYFGMSVFYTLQYLLYPTRIFRFVINFFGNGLSNTVFEQRMSQNLKTKLRPNHSQ